MQFTCLRIYLGYLNRGEGNKLECLFPKPLSCFPFGFRTRKVSSALLPVFVENSTLFAVGNVVKAVVVQSLVRNFQIYIKCLQFHCWMVVVVVPVLAHGVRTNGYLASGLE